MAALGGADQPGLAEQIQLLREQNNLLVQQNLQLQQGRPAARVQPQPERRRFLEPPTEADLDEQRLYLMKHVRTRQFYVRELVNQHSTTSKFQLHSNLK